MLEESLRLQQGTSRVRLCIRQPGLKALLEIVLNEWHFQPCDEPLAAGVLLAEEGAIDSDSMPHQQIIWLGSTADSARECLQFPLDLCELYGLLERHYHNPPRRHLRLALDRSCELSVAGGFEPATLASLSDRGCRLIFSRELARDVMVELRYDLVGAPVNLPGKVIYCVPRHRATQTHSYDIGLLFTDIDRTRCEELLDFIVASYFLQARHRLPADDFAKALECIALSDGARQFLAGVRGC